MSSQSAYTTAYCVEDILSAELGFSPDSVDAPPPLSLELFMEDTTSLLFGSVSESQLSEDDDAVCGGMVDACDMFDSSETPSTPAPSSSCASPTPEVDSRFCFSAIALHTPSPGSTIGRAPDDSARLSSEAVQKAVMKKKKGRGRTTRRHHGGSASTSPRSSVAHSSPRASVQRERRFSPVRDLDRRMSVTDLRDLEELEIGPDRVCTRRVRQSSKSPFEALRPFDDHHHATFENINAVLQSPTRVISPSFPLDPNSRPRRSSPISMPSSPLGRIDRSQTIYTCDRKGRGSIKIRIGSKSTLRMPQDPSTPAKK
eukprot:TRINITY_DN3168_c0_g1_i1.p1 TRINITY_DN3168_c0_g1~~TRINITY_DN3168_c0_g1_i1.p1  ORF type:complete len:314 (-),score=76.45 TRINITY_DN3168_c0_g1_i1:423-1364(-)